MERLNGEIISGSALAFLAILFISAGMVNPIWAVALPADYILLAVGIAVIGLGIWTRRNANRMRRYEEHPH
jgi:putative Ca2+/H+ antiporter (TMEM165/GDT1 family)